MSKSAQKLGGGHAKKRTVPAPSCSIHPYYEGMSTVPAQQLRDGLFCIPWAVKNLSNSPKTAQVKVDNLTEVFEYYVLTVTLLDYYGYDENPVHLDMEAALLDTINSPELFKNITVMATLDGLQQKMTLNESKWTSSWDVRKKMCPNCSSSLYYYNELDSIRNEQTSLSFTILIDVAPDSVGAAKKKSNTKHLIENLSKLWDSKALSDVSFKCGEETIDAHTCILASGSPILAAMFQNDFKENRKRIVKIEETSPEVIKKLFRYIYTEEAVWLENDEAENLLIAADKYAVDPLKEECAAYLSQSLAVENAARHLVLAHMYNSQKLRESALDFMAKNGKAVCAQKNWLDLIKNYPELCFQATQFMFGM